MGFSLKSIAAVANPAAFLGTALGGGLDFYQAEKNREAAKDANRRSEAMARENMAIQREFAQHGIRWKVEDAIRAGIHPLAALGTNTQGFSPVSVAFTPETDDRAGSFSRMGQNLMQSYMATANADERMASKLRLENMALQNDLLRSQITSINNPKNPPVPVAGSDNFLSGQGDSGTMLVKPSERTASAPGRPAQEAGWRPDVSYSRSDTGLVPVIPQGLSESMEDDFIGKILWRVRNQLMPNIGLGGRPPKGMLPRGYDHWKWNRWMQEWRPGKGVDQRAIGRWRKQ